MAAPSQSTKTLIRPLLPKERAQRKWAVSVNGATSADVSSVDIAAPQFGVLRYGMTPGGYDGWSFSEAGGGGSAIVPFCLDGERLLIGTIREVRPYLGGEVNNVPRGFIDPGEDHCQAARRELAEETGFDCDNICLLPGDPVNCNSTFFETAAPHLGIRFFAAEVPAALLERHDAIMRLRSDIIANDAASRSRRQQEGIAALEFTDWTAATHYRDMFTLAAIARLLAWLARSGRYGQTSS